MLGVGNDSLVNGSTITANGGNSHEIMVAKSVTMVVLCTVSICMGILPMYLGRWLNWNSTEKGQNPRNTKVVGLLLGFGGGVLFCTTFIHLIPEVRQSVALLSKEGIFPDLHISLAETLTCLGFFIMYLVEESVHCYLRRKQSQRVTYNTKTVYNSTSELVENGSNYGMTNIPNGNSHGHCHSHSHLPPAVVNDDDDIIISSLKGLLIVLGLSVHELFEGLAIGLESSAHDVWYMFAAVAAHKFVIAFCIGVELVANKTLQYLAIVYVCIFAIVSPLGIGIGMLLVGGNCAASSGPLPVILQGLASGTLLYVVFFEILQEHRTGMRQYISILIGFCAMLGLQMLTAHSHSHGGHGHGHCHEHSHPQDHDQHHHEKNL